MGTWSTWQIIAWYLVPLCCTAEHMETDAATSNERLKYGDISEAEGTSRRLSLALIAAGVTLPAILEMSV